MKTKARSIAAVIDKVLVAIPRDNDYEGLRLALVRIQKKAAFTAPEAMGMLWAMLASVLGDEIGEPTAAWQVKIQQIVRGEV